MLANRTNNYEILALPPSSLVLKPYPLTDMVFEPDLKAQETGISIFRRLGRHASQSDAAGALK